MQGEDSVRAAIKSIAIVPVEDWSIDLITPNPVCVMQDGKCVQTMFRNAPDSKKVNLRILRGLESGVTHFITCFRLSSSMTMKIESLEQILLIYLIIPPS